MKKRTKILISTLAISFLLMMLFLVLQHGAPLEQVWPGLAFGIVLILLAIFSQRIENKFFKDKSFPKIVIGSLALAFALMFLTGILALPFAGFKALEYIMVKNAGVIWLILAVIVSPITAKYME